MGSSALNIGFIGVGHMGGPMCRNIVTKGLFDVLVYDVNSVAMQECVAAGAKSGNSIAEVVTI
jgi:3-hydroxyisobutyrate dehydrogenase-like beta-hydroxyacid dehydrogenase